MPVYTYRREDGSTFDLRQKFSDDALTVDPVTGQKVQRIVQSAGVIFKGSGFYINDSKSKNSAGLTTKKSETSSSDTTTPASDASAPKTEATPPAPAKTEPVKSTATSTAAD